MTLRGVSLRAYPLSNWLQLDLSPLRTQVRIATSPVSTSTYPQVLQIGLEGQVADIDCPDDGSYRMAGPYEALAC